MINFCHIIPTKLLPEFAPYNGSHLLLAHLIEESLEYRAYYESNHDGKFRIMDNSAFEMYKQGKEMMSPTKLSSLAKAVRADMVVMTDYPNEDGLKTIKTADYVSKWFKDDGFQTFFCPQSVAGDMDDLMLSIEWAVNNPNIDRIGISILNCPIACNIIETKHGDEGLRNDAFRLQRFLSRWAIFGEMDKRGLLLRSDMFHCLGMTDGPREIELLKDYHQYIASWDSSAAVWAGVNGIEFDKSPTGLINGKFEEEVDFDWEGRYDVTIVRHNIQFINRMCANGGYSFNRSKGFW